MPKGLLSYCEYRETGLPWLGPIPAHWEVRRNGRLFGQHNETGFGELPILEVSLRTGVRVRDFDNSSRKQVMSDRSKYKRAVTGDITYNMMRLWQGAVGVPSVNGLVSPAYVVARPYPEVESRYYAYLFRTDAYKNEVNKYSRGIVTDRNRLYWDEFKQMPSVFPPADEQRLIADFLDEYGRYVQRFVRNKRRLIDLLNEQKQAIINQAVTRGLDPNARVKPSGIDWLGDVPEHWEARRLKYLVRNINDAISEKKPEELYVALEHIRSWSGEMTASIEDVPFDSQAKRFRPGDILFGKLRPYLAKVWRANQDGVCVSELLVLRPASPRILPGFLETRLRSREFIDLVNSSTFGAKMPRADWTFIGNTVIYVPPDVVEQEQILRGIHETTAHLEVAVRRANREIELIREYRSRLIADVVTGKLDVRGVELPDVEGIDVPSNLDLEGSGEDGEAGAGEEDDGADADD